MRVRAYPGRVGWAAGVGLGGQPLEALGKGAESWG
jgi:hypothetical protein